MNNLGEVWTLRDFGRTIGSITIDDADFLWLEGTFEPRPGFERFRPLFDRSPELVTDHPDEWEVVQIQAQLELHSKNGPTAEHLLHIENDRAWFRWSDTPFD
ncbi:hypothetical protein SAMN05216298_2237 [Glycomyces sambucus]|uniref:Uncharacterized protein n=1 Tax=Glycomyces sambucus TaxID=380244 RepID=A0A1G9GJ12_9ACTN|nr:hypothetical protein [Glycomyces sambucus]SDL00670.1 hypothetical protein SAMN05216298_2237 [Glycomyces sambucus]